MLVCPIFIGLVNNAVGLVLFHLLTEVGNVMSTAAFSEITIKWSAATTLYCTKTLQYYVSISLDNETTVDSTSTENVQVTFSQLDNGTLYQITILAANEAGNGTATTIDVFTANQGLVIECVFV